MKLSETLARHAAIRTRQDATQPGGNSVLDSLLARNPQRFKHGVFADTVEQLLHLPEDENGRKFYAFKMEGNVRLRTAYCDLVTVGTVKGLENYVLGYHTASEISNFVKTEKFDREFMLPKLDLFCPPSGTIQSYREDQTFKARYYCNDIPTALSVLAEWCGDKMGTRNMQSAKVIFDITERLEEDEKWHGINATFLPSRTP